MFQQSQLHNNQVNQGKCPQPQHDYLNYVSYSIALFHGETPKVNFLKSPFR